MTGHGVFDGGPRTRVVITMSPTDSHRSTNMELVADGLAMYMRSSEFGSLPEGRKWMGMDLSSFIGEEGSVPAGGDPKGALQMLEAATGDVQKLGREKVRGVPTTQYRATIEPADSARLLRERGAEDAAVKIAEDGQPLQVEAWIDDGGRVRRMGYVQTQPRHEGKGPTTVDTRIDFFDFGLEPAIEVPDSSEVWDATSLVKESAAKG